MTTPGETARVAAPDAVFASDADGWVHGAFESSLRPAGLGGGACIWLVDPEDPGPYGDTALLCPEEQARAARFFRDVDRQQYTVAHALLRAKLGERLGCAPLDVAFTAGPHGRPEVVPTSDLSFSLSHTRGLVGCGIARGVTIGLDLEPLRPLDALSMAHGILDDAELADVRSQAGETGWQRFLQYWTLKEATLKVRGTGLTLPAAGAGVRWRDGALTAPYVTTVPDGSEPSWHQARLWRVCR